MQTTRIATTVLTASALATSALAATAAPAAADYGNDAKYQIELSVNIPGPHGGGVWLWYELDRDGGGDYQGSDCGHGGEGAAHDSGDVHWSYSADDSQIVIQGTVLNGLGGFPSTVTIPADLGHHVGTDETFMTLPPFIPSGIGNSQLQVAP
jgi:hypothetical protein